MADLISPGAVLRKQCVSCALEVPVGALACPSCHTLVHATELRTLARSADDRARGGDTEGAITAYRRALELLPRDSKQHAQIASRIDGLTASGPARPSGGSRRFAGRAAGIGGAALILWKFKSVLLLVLGKGKFLLLGLTKAGTVFSMLASLGVYWALWGWQLAAGLIASMYVHEIGHVAALRGLGIAATAPMFIPGLGAMVRMTQYPASPREDAQVGLAGPVWGLGAALFALAVGHLANLPVALAIARLGGWLNLFNLIPFGPLDGGRGFRALAKRERWIVSGVILGAWLLTGEGMMLLVLLVAAGRAAFGKAPAESDMKTAVVFSVLIACLGALVAIDVPVE